MTEVRQIDCEHDFKWFDIDNGGPCGVYCAKCGLEEGQDPIEVYDD